MSRVWAAMVKRDDAPALASLWPRAAVEVCEVADEIWIRGEFATHESSPDLVARLRQLLPGRPVFRLGEAGELTRPGQRIPCGRLPAGQWRPLREWLSLRLPWSESEEKSSRTNLRLVRSGEETSTGVLSVSLSLWRNYAETAPRWRLESLAMAVDAAGQVLLRGEPLPPLPGTWWSERKGICVPSGWTWRPRLAPEVLRRAFALPEGDWAFLQPPQDPAHDFTWRRVRETDWVRATRASIRATWEAWHGQRARPLR